MIKASSSVREDGCKVGHCGKRSRRHGSLGRREHGSVDLRRERLENSAIHVTTCPWCASLHLLVLDALVNVIIYKFRKLICVATGLRNRILSINIRCESLEEICSVIQLVIEAFIAGF